MNASSLQHAKPGFWAEDMLNSRTVALNQQIAKNELLQVFPYGTLLRNIIKQF